MESKTNYSVVGLIVLLLAAGLLSVGLWLSVGFNQKSYSYYTVYLHEAAAGLSTDSPVKFNGVQVGFVKDIKLNKNDPRQVEILLSIEKGTPITNSTSATLISQGITGVTYVGLSAGSSDLTPLLKMPDEPYPVIPAKPSLFYQLDAIIRQVSENVNKVSEQIQGIFNQENAKYVRQSLKSTDEFMANMAKVSKDFPGMMKDLKVGIKHFNGMAKDLSTASRGVTKTMHSGRNAIDKMTPDASQLLKQLNEMSANLEQITNEMRQNPSVIIRGAKPPKPGPGE